MESLENPRKLNRETKIFLKQNKRTDQNADVSDSIGGLSFNNVQRALSWNIWSSSFNRSKQPNKGNFAYNTVDPWTTWIWTVKVHLV